MCLCWGSFFGLEEGGGRGRQGLPCLPDPSGGSRSGSFAESDFAGTVGDPFLHRGGGDGLAGRFLAVGLGLADGGDGDGSADHLERTGPAGSGVCHIPRGLWGSGGAGGGDFANGVCGDPGLEPVWRDRVLGVGSGEDWPKVDRR